MRITESKIRLIRQIIHNELLNVGFVDDMIGHARSIFGGADDGAGSPAARPLKLSDLIPLEAAISAAGFTREDINRLAAGRPGDSLLTRTYPAGFNFGLTSMGDGVKWEHPFLVRGAIVTNPTLQRYVDGGKGWRPDSTPGLKIPEESRFPNGHRLGSISKFPKQAVSDADLKRMGVNMTQWNEFTRELGPERRERQARLLARALFIVKELRTAWRVLDDVFQDKSTLFRPRG